VDDGEARTCESPFQSTSKGASWFLVSGHWIDVAKDDGARDQSVRHDGECFGCIDWAWKVPG